MGEFELIARYFADPSRLRPHKGVVLGIGDDCALVQPAPGVEWAISTDMLVEGRHFFPDVDPHALGHKALAVNLSDLAACGARPVGFTLALALPQADPLWLERFSQGLFALADRHGCALVGGDTTHGTCTVCITVFGEVPPGQALLRSGACAGDDIYVSGTLGDARLALGERWGEWELHSTVHAACRERMERPVPRVALGIALRGIASAAADISDGLLGDLGHILQASAVGASVNTADAAQLLACGAQLDSPGVTLDRRLDAQGRLACVLAGGDDYELVFTAPAARASAVQAAGAACGVPVTRIGRIESAPGLRLVDGAGAAVANTFASFDHFAPSGPEP